MLEQLICFLMTGLGASNYFDKIFPLVDLIPKGDFSRPAQYMGSGQYDSVNNFDHYNGMAYFRQTGAETVSRVDNSDSDVPCKTLLQISYPLRLVCCIPKSKLPKDDAFADDRIATDIMKLITTEGGSIVSQLKASSVFFIPTNVISKNKDVLDEEYAGYQFKDINFKFAYLAIDLSATVIINKECIVTDCENY